MLAFSTGNDNENDTNNMNVILQMFNNILKKIFKIKMKAHNYCLKQT